MSSPGYVFNHIFLPCQIKLWMGSGDINQAYGFITFADEHQYSVNYPKLEGESSGAWEERITKELSRGGFVRREWT